MPGKVSVNVLPLPGSLDAVTLAAMRRGNPHHEIQAKAAALDLLRDCLAAPIKRIEDVFAIFGIDAEAAVFDRESHRIAGVVIVAQLDNGVAAPGGRIAWNGADAKPSSRRRRT